MPSANTVIRAGGQEPATLHYTYSPGANVWFDGVVNAVPRMIYVNSPGVLTMRDSANVWASYTVVAGTTLKFRPTQIAASSNASAIMWN